MPSLWLAPKPLVLASGSRARAAMLAAAGIPFEAHPADLDEREVEDGAQASGVDQAGVAAALARAKALAVSGVKPGRLVLGADQTLALDGEALHKPADEQAAVLQLRSLAGRTHVLTSAGALVRDGEVLGTAVRQATIRMRPLSDAMIGAYLAAAGPGLFSCVGGYEIEAMGVHLFEEIEGDHFTIMGLPLLSVLPLLRRAGALAE